jgi:hypothetical protein
MEFFKKKCNSSTLKFVRFTTNYSQIPGEKSEKFKGASLLVLSQSLLSYILATSVNYYFNANFKSVLDNEEKFKLGFFNA